MPAPSSVVRRLSDQRLRRGLEDLARQDRAVEVDLLVHIAEVDKRNLFLVAGYSSLFCYLRDGLHFSDDAAYNRMTVARAARKHPAILEHIRDGRLNLTSARTLAPRLTGENCPELLERAKFKTKRQVEELLADLDPRPDAPELVRQLPASSGPARPAEPALAVSQTPDAGPSAPAPSSVRSPAAPAPQPPTRSPEPLGSERFKIQFTANREFVETLEEVQSLLRHQVPDGNLPEVFGRALRMLRDELKRRKFGTTERPARRATPRRNGKRSRHVPNAIRRAVAKRDEESCSYVSPDGRRCGSKDFLEYEHQDPWAKYGVHSTKRIRLLCRRHNLLAAQDEFGRDHMAQFTQPREKPTCGQPSPRGESGS